jgi:hypothetical protein
MKYFLILLLVSITLSCNQKENCCEYSISQKDIIGHWIEYAVNDTLSTYDFYPDGRWIRNTEPKSAIVGQGKYVVAPDGAVFMRHLGSRHWPSNNNNVQDLRTSIGSFVLFLEDSIKPNKRLLINNQEDYESAWIKK